ncbi:MAG TPA: DUF4249 domain-containing protein [Bacteroidales bacterium]|nr:DUF4249 domain-containing protein [Bacteroidales bacterium]
MKFGKIIYITVVTLIVATSCTEKVDIQLDESYTRLVVDGSITSDTLAHTIRLTTTTSYYYNQPAPGVSGALVSITDGTTVFPLTETSPGIYQTADTVAGSAGHTYTLNITLKQAIGGNTDYKATSYLNHVSSLDSVALKFQPQWGDKGFYEVKVYVQEPPTVDYYRFMIYKNDGLLTDTITEWFVTDDKFFNGSYTNGAAVGYLNQSNPSEQLDQGDVVTVEVDNIGKDYCNFIWNTQSEIRGANPLFSGPPANVTGNISNGAIGYFAAYSCTRSKRSVR